MNEIKQLAGILNYDDPDMALPLNNHADAQNIRFTGQAGNLRAENIEGNVLVANPYLPVTGVNTTIGTHFDEVKNRTFFFNYNSTGLHGIYILNSNNTYTVVLATNLSFADPLGFDPNISISSIDILYNDSVDGDVLYFLDSLNRPTKLNIPRYIANTYSPVKREFIDVIKAPPTMPIKCTYENDYTISNNNLKNSLFSFIYRFVYDDSDKSVWSSGSLVPLPYEPFDKNIDNNKFYNSRIALYLQTGDVNVKKIELAFKQGSNGSISDYYLITSLNKSTLSIGDNTVYRFVFYNDGQYTPIDKKEQVLLYDYVPLEAKSQALLNGNVAYYANILEGYDLTTGVFTPTNGTDRKIFDVNGVSFFGIQGNDDSLGTGNLLTLYLTGVGDNDGSNNCFALYNNALEFHVRAVNASNVDVSFTATTATANIASIFSFLQAAAVAKGFTYVSQTTNSITFSFIGYSLQSSTVNIQRLANGLNTNNAAVFTQGFESNYDYGVLYFDKAGRTNSVITTQSLAIKTITAQTGDDNLLPLTQISTFNRPPIWASYYHYVASKNLTYLKRFNWVSKRTSADTQTINGNKFAYIDISNIIDYNAALANAANTLTQGVVSYDFATGDRIRFIRRYPQSGSPIQLTTQQYDYEIVGVSYSVIINGVIQSGTFVKIKYPTADIGTDFAFTGNDFQNYQIFIYSYAKHTDVNSTVYYDIGHRGKIGNAGTTNAYHIANLQTQSIDLTIPSIENIVAGDYFSRYRTVPAGNTYQIPYGGSDMFAYNLSTFATNPNPVIDITGNYSIHAQQSNLNSGFGLLEYPSITDNNYHFYNASSTLNKTVRIRTTISQFSSAPSYFQMYAKLCFLGQTVPTSILIVDDQAINSTGIAKLYPVDITIVVPPLNKLFLLTAGTLGVNKVVVASTMTFDVVVDVTIPIIEKSFSDIYDVELNSFSRQSLVDINSRQQRKLTLARFSEPAQQGTNINLSNRFYPNNTDEYDRQWGEVVRTVVSGRQLIIFQYANTGQVGIYSKFIKDNSGSANLITTDSIITPNNIQYYIGGFGIRNQPLSLTKNGHQFYFADSIKGVICRLSQDGIIPISELYKIQTFTGTRIAAYQQDSVYQFGGKAKILSVYNQLKNRHGEIIFIFQAGTGGGVANKPALSIVFDETHNAFTSSYGFNPDQLVCAGNRLFTFYNGNAYEHNDVSANRRFYGQVFYPSITLVFNKEVILRKVFDTISYLSNQIWVSDTNGDIITSELNDQTQLPQISSLKDVDYTRRGNILNAAFLNDANSGSDAQVALLEGDVLNGVFITVKLTYKGSDNAYIYLPTVLSQEDHLNLKNH